MIALGEKLRRAREKRSIPLSQAALETRIRLAILEAIEAGELASLPPRPFLRGLLRIYAQYLHLDPDLVLDEYDMATGFKPVAKPPDVSAGGIAPQSPLPVSTPEVLSSSALRGFPSSPSSGPESTSDRYEINIAPPAESPTFPPFGISRPVEVETSLHTAAIEKEVAHTLPLGVPPETIREAGQDASTGDYGAMETRRADALSAPRGRARLAQWIGNTRLPEASALVALAIALLVIVSVGFDQLTRLNPLASSAISLPTATATATIPANSTPTAIPTLAETLDATAAPTLDEATPTALLETAINAGVSPTPFATPTLDVPADAQMTLEIEALGPMYVWVLVDDVQVQEGMLQNETRSWTAHERIFLQVKNIGNGRVIFNGRRILPRNQQERSDLVRAWQMSPRGTPVAVPPTPYPATIAPTRADVSPTPPGVSAIPTGFSTTRAETSPTPTEMPCRIQSGLGC